jgi:DNA-binding transcriptional LysR family regulator
MPQRSLARVSNYCLTGWGARRFRRGLIEPMPDHPLQSSLQTNGIHFVYNVNRRQSRKVHAFMDYLIPRIASLLV